MGKGLTEFVSKLHSAGVRYHEALAYFEKQYTLEVLCRHDWNLVKTANALQIHRNTLTRRLQQFGIRHSDKDVLMREWRDRKVSFASEKRPVFLKENGVEWGAPRGTPLSRLAGGHRDSGAERP
jgi:hypothetical protein